MDAPTVAQGRQADLNVACPLCKGGAYEVVSERDRDGSPLTTVLCTSCGHVFTVPIPTTEQLAAYYADKYRHDYKAVARPKPKHVLRAGRRALERLDNLSPHAKASSRLLDIGAGGGEFVYLAGKAGYAARGVEPNRGYAAHARKELDIDVTAATFQEVEFDPGSYDVITLHHVLEHLPDPAAALAQIRSWLTPSGTLMLEVPNVLSTYHSPSRRFHRAHLHTFNRLGLEDLVRNAGFSIVSVSIVPHTSHIGVIARRAEVPSSATWRNAAAETRAALRAHTMLSRLLSGRALQRFWSNVKRPIVEAAALMSVPDRSARAILDKIWKGAAP